MVAIGRDGTIIRDSQVLSAVNVKQAVNVHYSKALYNWKNFQKKRGAKHYGGNSVFFKKFDKSLLDSIISDLTAAIQISSGYHDVYELRAHALEQKLDYAKACQDWESAIKLTSPLTSCTIPDKNGNCFLYSQHIEWAQKKRDRKGKISGFILDTLINLDEDGKCIPDDI